MGIVLHWFLPTNGDSRTDLSLGNAVGAAGSRVAEGGSERAPDIRYIGQIARSAEQLGFTGALTPTSSWCEDSWIMTAALTQVTERFKLAGWLTLILSFTTCTIPGYLLLLGEWGHIHTWLVLVVIAATVVALLPIGSRSLRKSPGTTEQAEAGVPVSVA